MKTIPLTKGKGALVDDEDYVELAKYKWYANESCSGCWYAHRKGPRNGGRGTLIQMHRALIAGDSPLTVDHINGDGLDNRRANLRLTTPSGNQRNRKAHRAGRLVGAYYHRGEQRAKPWQAAILDNGRMRHLGYSSTEQEAHDRFVQADAIMKARGKGRKHG